MKEQKIMKRANTRIGDVFSVKMDNNKKKYLQYVISDLTQLNSDVIRVFKTEYPDDKNPNLLLQENKTSECELRQISYQIEILK